VCRLTLDVRMDLVRSFAQEVIQEDELRCIFANKLNPVAYDGFEPSGRMHIAQGVMKALNVNKLTKCGVRFKFWCGQHSLWMRSEISGSFRCCSDWAPH
jgi:tyrosyl-tRNA synthetase